MGSASLCFEGWSVELVCALLVCVEGSRCVVLLVCALLVCLRCPSLEWCQSREVREQCTGLVWLCVHNATK